MTQHDPDLIRELEEAALTLENEGEFYKEYQKSTSKASNARNLIRSWLKKNNLAPTYRDTIHFRESLRRYFNERYDLDQQEDSAAMASAKVAYPWGDDPTMPPKAKIDYSALIDGTIITVKNGQTYVKGAKTHDGYPSASRIAQEQEEGNFYGSSKTGFVFWRPDGTCPGALSDSLGIVATKPPAIDYSILPTGTKLYTKDGRVFIKGVPTAAGLPIARDRAIHEVWGSRDSGWNGWPKDGSCSREELCLVSYELPAEESHPAPPELRRTDDYSALPDGITLVCKNGQKFIKGRRTKTGLPNLNSKTRTFKPLWGAGLTGWQDWWSSGDTGSTSAWDVDHYLLPTDAGAVDPTLACLEPLKEFIDPNLKIDLNTNSLDQFTTPKETTMTQIITITTKTLVNGVDVAAMSKATIYDLIAQQEATIETLEAIKTKPLALKKEIAERQAGIQALVDYLDSQEEPAKADAKAGE